MTDDEIRDAFNKLVNEVPSDRKVFIMIYDDTGEGENYVDNIKIFGIGCSACSAEIILKLYLDGKFMHNGDRTEVKH